MSDSGAAQADQRQPTEPGQSTERQRSQAGGSANHQGKVSLRLRIGITGHRNITGDHPGLASEIYKAAEYITQVLAADSDRLSSKDSADGKRPDIVITVVSSLAEGADRVVAGQLLKRKGTQLEVVLPLPQSDYLHDFASPESVEQFNHLMARAISTDVLRTATSREQAYEQAGHAVVDRSDAMIVVWDGQPARGRGGTAAIYAYAQRWQKPTLVIRVDNHAARLDASRLPQAAKGTIPLLLGHMEKLDQYNHKCLKDAALDKARPLLVQSDYRPWLESAGPQIAHFSRYFTRADLLAGRFQSRYLWATRSLYVLAPLAVLVAALQLDFWPRHDDYAWFEFGILVLVTLTFAAARGLRWHERWISARYLAEQIRSLMFLGLTGIITPEKSISSSSRETAGDTGWTERAANEIWFARPRYVPPTDIGLLVEVLCENWIKKQQEYHIKVDRSFRRRRDQIQAAAIGLFGLSALVALLHSLGVGSTESQPFEWWDLLAIGIPAIAAALGAYGAQRDYLRHAERSKLFASVLDDGTTQLMGAQDLSDIQQAALSVSRSMRSEATDWYSVVRVQDAELPS
jgi:SMODS and SLOG-associating 2TM effector domain 3